eukprot:GEMP01018339.1.p1 GENE.GEMP01018339.1~~GEMP01018339.1.p1  ORF type:complete len:654 (+),score=91.96 GEMP01018339.1:144-2105(+)
MALSISLPKVVVIENTRLAILYYALMIAVCFGAIYITLTQKKYLVRQQPTTFPSIYITTPSLDDLNERIANYTGPNANTICQNTSFKFTFNDDFTYENIACKQLPQALAYSKVSGTTFFFPTFYSDEYVFQEQNAATEVGFSLSNCEKLKEAAADCGATITPTACYKSDNCGTSNNLPSCYCSIRKKNQFWTLGVELIRVSLTHRYEVQKGGISISKDDDGKEKGSTSPSGKEEQIRTYIMQKSTEASGKIGLFDCGHPKAKQCYFDSGQDIVLTLEQILQAAGIRLTDYNDDRRVNDDSPPFRLTGAEVSITAEYKNTPFHYDLDGIDSEGPHTHCYIQISANTGWTSRIMNTEIGSPQLVVTTAGTSGVDPNFDDITSVQVRQRYQQGIQLQFMGATTSEFGFFDFPALAAIIAVFLLYIGIVPLLIKLIAIYLLGNTSRTYKRAQQEVLQVQESCQREFPAKMLTATTVFYMISTIEQMGKKGISISNRGLEGNVGFDVLSHLLGHCLKEEKELDEGETKNIIQSIYEQLGGDDGHVSLSEFIRAFTHSEVFDMEALINTYDVQRKRNCMEYIFADATDRAVAKERKEREKAGEDMSGVKEDEENPELGTGVTEDPDAAGGGKPKGKGKGAKKQRSGSPRAQGPTPENTQ